MTDEEFKELFELARSSFKDGHKWARENAPEWDEYLGKAAFDHADGATFAYSKQPTDDQLPSPLVALAEVIEIIWLGQNIKHRPEAATIERMLLKRGIKLISEQPHA